MDSLVTKLLGLNLASAGVSNANSYGSFLNSGEAHKALPIIKGATRGTWTSQKNILEQQGQSILKSLSKKEMLGLEESLGTGGLLKLMSKFGMAI